MELPDAKPLPTRNDAVTRGPNAEAYEGVRSPVHDATTPFSETSWRDAALATDTPEAVRA